MLKKIAVADLCEGMYLQELCGSWTSHPFWRTRFVIKDAAQIRLILDSGITEVWIDTALGKSPAADPSLPEQAVEQARYRTPEQSSGPDTSHREAGSAPAVPPAKTAVSARKVSLHDEMQRAAGICHHAAQAVNTMFQEARMGKAISSKVAGALVDEISASVLRNPGALISLARLKTADNYTYMHSVAVCGLMVALSHQLGLDDAQSREAGMAGLLHDVGKMMVAPEILNKPGKLTDAEFAAVKEHPTLGHRLLAEGAGVGDAVLDVCLHHHEKMDGAGYPHGLKADQISLLARMGAICDVYDATTSNRPYKAGWDPGESIHRMTGWCGGHLDPRVFQAFVKSIGIYPTGSLVRLASGRLAMVLEQSKQSLLSPVVKAFFSINTGLYITPEVIHLSGNAGDRIVGVESAADWEITKIERFWTA